MHHLHFGFSYVGLIYLILLFIPNLIFTKYKPIDYEQYLQKENKILVCFEKIGQILVCITVLIFKDFNIHSVSYWTLFLLFSFVLMILYESYWISYFRSPKRMSDFYKKFLGIPVAGATLPILAFLLLGIYGKNIILILSVLVLGIGHIGIHLQHNKEVKDQV